MNELLEKAYNCYIRFLNRLNYGNVTQNYCLLYDAILYIANDLDEEQFYQYFVNNLDCGTRYPLDITEDMDRLILWTLNESSVVLNTFQWNTIPAPADGTFSFTTNQLEGYNWLYISVPQDVNMYIYNELNMQLYDSLAPVDGVNQLFNLVGTMTTVNGDTNNVYRKNEVFNSHNRPLFKVKIY